MIAFFLFSAVVFTFVLQDSHSQFYGLHIAVLEPGNPFKQAVRVATRFPAPLLPVGAPPSRRNVAVVSHAQYVFTVTAAPASRLKAALSKADW